MLQEARQIIERKIAAGEPPASDDFLNRWSRYRDLLFDAQFGKCAYCESRFAGGYAGAVEHYRPKTEIRALRMTAGGNDPTFKAGSSSKPGYWWLAYDFGNMLYSCGSCNSAKGSYFPVEGYRPKPKPGSQIAESPRLLNPFSIDPAGHLSFFETGRVTGTTPEGKWTVRICGLLRGKLTSERFIAATSIVRDVEDYEDAVTSDNALAQKQALRRLHDACTEEARYAAMARQIVKQRTSLKFSELEAAHLIGII